MTQVGTNQATTYHSQPSLSTSVGQTGRSSSTSRQQQSQYDNEQLVNIRPRLCILRKWPHYDGYGVHLARNQHWLGLRIGDVEPNSPAESGGLLREDVVLAVNGRPVENDDFFVILSFIQRELEDDQIRFLVLDPHSADSARRNHINIDESFQPCVRMETPTFTVSPEKLLYDQWRATNNFDPTATQNTIHLGPSLSINQNQANAQRYQQGPPSDGRDDVYTFLPYSDHAIENGKSFFDILFEQDHNALSTQVQQQQAAQNTIPYSPRRELTGDNDNEIDDQRDKRRASNIKDGVKSFVKTGFENFKSVLPTKHRDSKEKDESMEPDRKTSAGSINSTSNHAESPSLVGQIKNKFKQSSSPSSTTEKEKQSQAYESLWQASSQQEDTNNNLASEPRLCSLTLRPGIDTIGISLQPDKDFSHIIKQVEPNSPADRAGIEGGDCIVSLNDIPLLNIPYEDVLSTLKKSRSEANLDFLVAKKAYLLKSHPKKSTSASTQQDTSNRYTDTSANTSGEVMPSSNITGRSNTSSLPASQALEQLYNKYTDEQTYSNRPRETVSTTTTVNERYDQLSPQLDNDRYSSKQQQGQFLQGVGPATADRSSWGVSSRKSTDDQPGPISGDSSIRSNSQSRRPDADETRGRHTSLEDSFKPLQVGITNPTPSQQSSGVSPNIPSNTLADEEQRTSRPTSAKDQRDSSPKALPSPDAAATSTHVERTSSPSSTQKQGIQDLKSATPAAPGQTSPTTRDYERESTQTTPSTQSDIRLGTTNAMSVPNKAVAAKPAMTTYSDTDDSELSDISEKSREDEVSDPVVNKNSQLTNTGSINARKNRPLSDSSQTATSGFRTPEVTSSSPNRIVSPRKNNDGRRELTPTSSDADQEADAQTPTNKSLVQARRLDQSDSEDTTSGTDSQPAKQSATDTFYSPDESVDDGNDTDDQRSSLQQQQREQPGKHHVTFSNAKPNLSLSSPPNQRREQRESDEDDDSTSSASSSTETPKTPAPTGRMALATLPISELKNLGYEFHNIQLMQPTETSPVGLKLTKQQDPLQYIITAVAKGTKADLAGLKINDWLIKIEDNDIRSVEFAEVSQEIRQLLTNAGLINMVIARKKTPSSSPVTKQVDKQPAVPSASRSESINRQQGGPNATSSLLTTDITRDTPDNSQVRFTPDQSTSPSTSRSQRSPIPSRFTNVNAPGGPLSVGLTNPISDENLARSPRSQSRSPTREFTINQQQKSLISDQSPNEIDQNEVRHVVLKEALGLDFNSFIPEGDSQVQTHFISNVQQSSMADKAGLRDGDRILTVNGVDVTSSVHEDVRRMMQSKKPLQLTVVNDPKYLELIENVKRNQNKAEGTRDRTNSPPPDYNTVEQEKSGGSRDSTSRLRPPLKSLSSDSGSESGTLRSAVDSPRSPQENLVKYLKDLFTDDQGTVQVKHCILEKNPSYNGYGLLLRYQNGLHLIDQVEENSPAYNAGLREDDVILFVDKKNVEQMTHDDVKILIRKLSLSNTNIDLILIKKNDVPRYKTYQERNSVDWKSIIQENTSHETIQTEQQQQQSSLIRPSDDQISSLKKTPSSSSSSSGKQPAPAPPTSSTNQSISSTGTRVCTLQPSVDRTAGFALSGKSPPPYIICQIEKNSPAEKAGLRLNDALLSINGKSVTEKSYDDTVKLIKEALQQKSVELIVRESLPSQLKGSQSSGGTQSKSSMGSDDSNHFGNNDNVRGGADEPSRQGSNAVEEYQNRAISSSSAGSSSATTKTLNSGRNSK